MSVLAQIPKMYPIINLAANDFLGEMSNTNIKRDIAISSQMAGLKLLRAAHYDLSGSTPGNMLLGVIEDELMLEMQNFIFAWACSNGIPPIENEKINIPDDAKSYFPEVSSMEKKLDNYCKHHNLEIDYYPFVAASSSLKMVSAGNQMNILDANIGLSMTMYHIILGSKTVPYPPEIQIK